MSRQVVYRIVSSSSYPPIGDNTFAKVRIKVRDQQRSAHFQRLITPITNRLKQLRGK